MDDLFAPLVAGIMLGIVTGFGFGVSFYRASINERWVKLRRIEREAWYITTICGQPGDAYWTPRVTRAIETFRELDPRY